MFSTTKHIIMNKVISHIHYIYIKSPLFTINIYFSASQYNPTLERTLAMKLSLHLICFIIRLYSCNIKPHLVNLWFLFCIVLITVTALWSVNTTNGRNVHQNASKITIRQVFFFQLWIIFSDLCQSFKENKSFGRSMSYLPSWSKTEPTPTSLTSNVNLYSFEKTCVVTWHIWLFFLLVGVFTI